MLQKQYIPFSEKEPHMTKRMRKGDIHQKRSRERRRRSRVAEGGRGGVVILERIKGGRGGAMVSEMILV